MQNNKTKPSGNAHVVYQGSKLYEVANSRKREARQMKKDNAQELVDKYGYYGGKRFLGVNSNGTPVWVSFKATEETIEVKLTHDLFSVMPENGGQYAAQRDKYWLTEQNRSDLNTYTEEKEINQKNRRTGRVGYNTLLHLEKIIDECEKYTRRDKKPPRSVFRLLAWNIYPGTWENYSVPDTNWDEVANIFNYKDEEGYYFTGQI